MERDLLSDVKELAEHIMLVDLGRNDVNRVSKPETTKVKEVIWLLFSQVDSLMHIERYSHVMHIVSQVSGILRDGLTSFDALRSIFPAGTLSGAPKIKAMELISVLEKEKRGLYGGAVGYFSFYRGDVDTCIAIRSTIMKDGVAHLQAGGGIVYDSNLEDEWKETLTKMGAVEKAIHLAEEEAERNRDLPNSRERLKIVTSSVENYNSSFFQFPTL